MGLQWGNKTKAISDRFRHIHSYFGIFSHIQACSGIIQAYSGIFTILCNPDIFRTLVYSKSEPKAYSESYGTSMKVHFAKIVNCYTVVVSANQNYFLNINFSCSPIFLIKVYFLLQKSIFYSSLVA